MVISTHLPPPVMIESAADLALVTHMLCCSCAMCFSAAASSENDHGSMNLASNTRVGFVDHAVERGGHPPVHGVADPPLDILDGPSRIALVPSPIERLR